MGINALHQAINKEKNLARVKGLLAGDNGEALAMEREDKVSEDDVHTQFCRSLSRSLFFSFFSRSFSTKEPYWEEDQDTILGRSR